MILIILSMSYACAVDNGTDTFKEQNNDLISINNQKMDNVSMPNEIESVNVINENNSSNMTKTIGDEILESTNNTQVLTVPLSKDMLPTTLSVTPPLKSSSYKVPTIQQRTFNIGGFKATLTVAQYNILNRISSIEDMFFDEGYNNYYYVGDKFYCYDITSTGLRKYIIVKTKYFVKVKLKVKNRVYYRNSRVSLFFSYGRGQCGVSYRHQLFLTHHYGTPAYDYIKILGKNSYYFGKCKHSAVFTTLNKSKLANSGYVYKRYEVK